MIFKLKLKSKILLLWFGLIVVSLAFIGILFVYLLNDFKEKTAKKQTYEAFETLSNHLQSDNDLLGKNLEILGNRKDVVSSTSMVDAYQDKKQYQSLVFNLEKKNLVRVLAAQARIAGLNSLSIYDSRADLIAYFTGGDETQGQSGFISYRDGKPVILARSMDSEDFREASELPLVLREKPVISPNWEKKITYRAITDGLLMEMVAPIIRTFPNGITKPVGIIRMAHYEDDSGAKEVSRDAGMDFTIYVPGITRIGPPSGIVPENLDYIPLHSNFKKGGPGFRWIPDDKYHLGATRVSMEEGQTAFYIFSKEKGPLTSEISVFQKAALSGLVLASLLIFSAGVFALNWILIGPVNRLIEGVEALKSGQHEKLTNFSKTDELGVLANSFDEMAETISQRERELRKLSTAVEQSPASVTITDAEGFIEYVNPKFERVTGYLAEEVIGHNPRILKSGETSQEEYERLWATITSGRGWHGEFHNKRKDGTLYWEQASISPIKAPDGTITHFLALKVDITEQKHLQEQLRRSHKMDAIGKLTGGIAHDYNNMLGVVMGYLELIEIKGNLDKDNKGRLGKAYNAAQRSANLTKKLLGFSSKQARGTMLTSVNDSITKLHDLIVKSLTVKIKVENRLADDLWLADIDAAEFEDVLLNLTINARDAMPDGGALIIETANKTLDADFVRQNPGSDSGDFIMITVSDTGTGMSREVQEKVFEPFFSTKDQDKGTGLGLSMVYGFVQRSGGHINISSIPGAGTSFNIYLPKAGHKTARQDNDRAAEEEIPCGSETVLIVDDEEALVDIAVYKLEQLGYHVITANNGRQALDVIENNSEIDLLFTDIIMPGDMDGYHLSLAAKKIRPSIKILLTSGFANRQEGLLEGDAELLSGLSENLLNKPYSYIDLAVAVRRALDEE